MRIIKKLIIYTTIIGTLLFSILVVFGFIYQDEVVDSVKTEINKHLNAEIKVSKIDLSFITNFPQASVTLKNVVGFESKNYSTNPDTLFSFEQFSLSFNIMDIIDKSYVLESIHAEEGFLNLEISKKGEGNYEIFKTDTTASSSFKLDLQSVTLTNCDIAFRDFRTQDKYRFYYPNLIANGVITDVQINTALYGTTLVKDLVLDNTSYLKGEKARVDVGVSINLETGDFQVSRGFLTLRDHYDFEVKGKTGDNQFRYTFESNAIDLTVAETLIPKKHIEFINAYKISGNAAVFLEIQRAKKANHPSISGSFNVNNGSLEYLETGKNVYVTKANGTFDLGKKAAPLTTVIEIPEFEISTQQGKASGSFQLRNLRHPSFKIITKGTSDLSELSKMADFGDDFKMNGLVDFNIKLTGSIQNLDSIITSDIRTFKGMATIDLKNGAFIIKQIPQIAKVSAQLNVTQNTVVLESFNGEIGGSVTNGKLKASNWLNYVLQKSKSLDLTGDIITDRFDVSDWVTQDNQEKAGAENQDFSFPSQLSFKGKIGVNTFKSEKVTLTNLRSFVVLANQSLKLENAYFNGFNGSVLLDYEMRVTSRNIRYNGSVLTNNVKVEDLLTSFNEFGQTALTSKNLKGGLNCDVKFSFASNKKFKISDESIYVDGDVMLLNGELIEYKLLYDIPKEIESNKIVALFVNLDRFEKRLHRIKFDTIANHLTIKNKVMTIPRMEIHSSALNISLQGTHSFDNKIDYYMNFKLSSVLSKKEAIKDEYGYLVDDDAGRIMYLHVYTKDGEIEVDVDKLGAKNHKNVTVKEEVKVVKTILKEELGIFKNDTSIVVTEKEASFEYEVDLGEFGDTIVADSSISNDSIVNPQDSTIFEKILKKKKKKKKKEENFEEWDFEDDDF